MAITKVWTAQLGEARLARVAVRRITIRNWQPPRAHFFKDDDYRLYRGPDPPEPNQTGEQREFYLDK